MIKSKDDGPTKTTKDDKTYEVLDNDQPIDGKVHKAGDKVKLDPKVAAILQSRGVRLSEVEKSS